LKRRILAVDGMTGRGKRCGPQVGRMRREEVVGCGVVELF